MGCSTAFAEPAASRRCRPAPTGIGRGSIESFVQYLVLVPYVQVREGMVGDDDEGGTSTVVVVGNDDGAGLLTSCNASRRSPQLIWPSFLLSCRRRHRPTTLARRGNLILYSIF